MRLLVAAPGSREDGKWELDCERRRRFALEVFKPIMGWRLDFTFVANMIEVEYC
jgi:hypothetical protein